MNADCLSRLPIKNHDNVTDVIDTFQLELLDSLPVTASKIAKETETDKELQKLLKGLQSGNTVHKSDRFNLDLIEFSLQKGIIMRGHRVVIPKILRSLILKELHAGHFGIVKMKNVALGHC